MLLTLSPSYADDCILPCHRNEGYWGADTAYSKGVMWYIDSYDHPLPDNYILSGPYEYIDDFEEAIFD